LQILVTNDDGIHADGLWSLVQELKEIGTVTVVAPDRDQSGTGTSVTLRQPLRLTRVASPVKGVKGYSVEGTPGDCVILALQHAVKDQVDVVISGINEGPNLGNDVFISGTVGAALQGYFYGIPSIAISVAAFKDLHWDIAAKLAGLLANSVKDGTLPQKMLLNVNVPNLPAEQITGIEITKLGERSYTDSIDQGHDGKRKYYWIVRGIPEWSVTPGTDIWAMEQNKISISFFQGTFNGHSDDFIKRMTTGLLRKTADPGSCKK
jgi:5'-nucleotidase